MSEKLRIAFCTDGIFPHAVGGMQRHSKYLIEHLAKSKAIDLSVIHPHGKRLFDNSIALKEFPQKGIDPQKNYLLECYRYSRRVFEVLQNLQCDVIYAQGLSVWYGIKSLKSPLVINPHGLEPFQSITRKDRMLGLPFRWLFRKLFKHATVVVSLGGHLTTILKKEVASTVQIRELPNAVELPSDSLPVAERKKSEIHVLFVGRFAFNKGINLLMDAIQIIGQTGVDKKFVFHLAGTGPLLENYKRNENPSNVHFHGFVDDAQLNQLYNTSDLFVLPTRFEGMPTVVLEAMARNLPIVVTDVGATSLLVDATNGFLIPKDSVSSLVEALLAFAQLDENKREKMKLASLNKVKNHFTWNAVTDRHIELFREITDKSDKTIPTNQVRETK